MSYTNTRERCVAPLIVSSFVLAIAIGAVTVVPASAQSLLASNGQMVATTYDPTPGPSGSFFSGIAGFDAGVIDDEGRVFFRAMITSTNRYDERALYYGSSREDLQLLVRSGDPEPSGTIAGAFLQTETGVGINGAVRINGNGTMLFGGSLYDFGVNITDDNDTALYYGTPGQWSILVREGDPAAGTNGAHYSSTLSFPSQQTSSMDPAGRVAFISNLLGGDVVGSTNNVAMFVGTPGNLTLVARKGQSSISGGAILATIAPSFVTQMNAQGQIAFDVALVLGSGSPPVTTANDRALWIYTPGSGLSELIREGDASPLAGVNFGSSPTSAIVNTGATSFNAQGEFLLRVGLSGAGITAGINDSALVLASPSGHRILLRRGDAAPGVPGATIDVIDDTSVLLNDSGVVAFQATMAGSVSSTNDSATWIGTPGNWQLVVREGDTAPDTGAGRIESPIGQVQMLNGSDQLLFQLQLLGGTNPGSSLWSWDRLIGLQAVVLSGETIEAQPGFFRTVNTQNGVQFSNGATRPLSLADDGTFTTRVIFTDRTSGIMISRIGSIFATPRTINTTRGGTQSIYLNAGGANAGNIYYLLGTMSGASPGFFLGRYLVPLNPDTFFLVTLSSPNVGPFDNTLGTLDAGGRALARITVPPFSPGAGLTLHWAYLAFPGSLDLSFVSGVAEMHAER